MNQPLPRSLAWTAVFVLSLWLTALQGQQSFIGQSIVLDTTDTQYRAAKKAFFQKYKAFVKQQTEKMKATYKDKAGKEMLKEYEASTNELMAQIKENQYIFDPKLDTLVRQTLKKFKIAGIPDPSSILFLISKDLSLNAYCLSDGVLLINAGLFLWLNNRDQFASVLAHELGHFTLNHYNDFRYQYLIQKNSKDSKEELKRIKKAETNKASIAQSSLRQKLYNQARTQRKHELEADSVGYTYYSSAGFPTSEYIKAMELMVKYDTLPYIHLDTSIYYTLFDLPEQKFKTSWLQGEDFGHYYYQDKPAEFHEDSLLSHPSTQIRIANLKKHYNIVTDTSATVSPDDYYREVYQMMRAEILPVFYFNEEYGVALYNVIKALQGDAENTYFRNWLGMLFTKIYEARKSYVLNRYVEAVDMRDKNQSYQQFLSFIWQLNLKEVKAIADHYAFKEP